MTKKEVKAKIAKAAETKPVAKCVFCHKAIAKGEGLTVNGKAFHAGCLSAIKRL